MSRKNKNNSRVDFVRSETDLFHDIGYDLTIQSSNSVDYHPQNSVAEKSAPITFFIQGNDLQYLDFYQSKLYIRAKLLKNDGTDLDLITDPTIFTYAPIQNFFHSMFEKVSVYLNEMEITNKSSLYPYRSYMEDFLGYSRNFKKSIGEATLLTKTESELNTTDAGWLKRKDIVNGSSIFEIAGKLHTELFSQTRYLIPGVDVRIQLHRSEDSFCIQTAGTNQENIKVEILEAKLIVKKHTLLPSIQLAHLKNLENGNSIIYPNRAVSMKSYSLPIGCLQNTNESLITGVLPSRIIVGLVNSNSVHGSYRSNPLCFEHFNLSQINCKVNGETITESTIELDVENKRSMLSYLSVFENLGLSDCDNNIDIKYSEYINGKILHVFNVRQVQDAFSVPKFGNISIGLRFKTALLNSVTIIIYSEYESCMYINSNRQIYFKDFTKE